MLTKKQWRRIYGLLMRAMMRVDDYESERIAECMIVTRPHCEYGWE